MTFSAVLVIILGLWNIPNGLALTGTDFSFGGSNTDVGLGLKNVEIVDGIQIVEMKVEGFDYYPHQFTILKDIPVEWRIEGSEAAGCGRILSAPSLGITEYISSEEISTIEFTATDLGTIPFSCSMGMMTPGAEFTVITP